MSQNCNSIRALLNRAVFAVGGGLATLFAMTVIARGDWPQFRGPDRSGIAAEQGLLTKWPAEGPPVAWKAAKLGEGFSSVSICGGRVFTMGDQSDGCYLTALDQSTGKNLWATKAGATGGNYRGPRSTPTVDSERVYALSQFGDLICCEAASGETVWRKNLVEDFGGQPGGWNYTESVLVDGGQLVCTPGGKEATMVAVNKKAASCGGAE